MIDIRSQFLDFSYITDALVNLLPSIMSFSSLFVRVSFREKCVITASLKRYVDMDNRLTVTHGKVLNTKFL